MEVKDEYIEPPAGQRRNEWNDLPDGKCEVKTTKEDSNSTKSKRIRQNRLVKSLEKG